MKRQSFVFTVLIAVISIVRSTNPAAAQNDPANCDEIVAVDARVVGDATILAWYTDVIDFENGFSELDAVGTVTTPTNQVRLSVTGGGPGFIAEVGLPGTAFGPQDTPDGRGAGKFFLTDEMDGPSFAGAYYMDFAAPVLQLSLDLYDYRLRSGEVATLTVYADAARTVPVGADSYTIPDPRPVVDGNVVTLCVLNPRASIVAATLAFDDRDPGTGIDNIRFMTATRELCCDELLISIDGGVFDIVPASTGFLAIDACVPGTFCVQCLGNNNTSGKSICAEIDPEDCSGGESSPRFIRGDTWANGLIEIGDAIRILRFLFLGSTEIHCLDAADVDDNGSIELSDVLGLLRFIVLGGDPPAAPFPLCGLDVTRGDPLDCASYPPCD